MRPHNKLKIACFKHLKLNCECTSPRKLSFGTKIRVPKSGDKKKWKEFALWILDHFNDYTINSINKNNTFDYLNLKHEKLKKHTTS